MLKKVSISAALIIAIIVAVNFLSTEFHLRLDLTEDSEYTLSDATQDILDDLEDPVTVKAYFTQNLPPQYATIRQSFQEALIEYANRADGKLIYEFVNPNENGDIEQEAVKAGIQPLQINVREKDQMKQQKAFMGATISLGDKEEIIPFVQPGAAMEYALSTAIKKLSVTDKPVIGFLQGHGEAPISEMIEGSRSLEILYTMQEVALSDSTDIPATIKTLAIVRPMDSIPMNHFQRLEGFMARGGRLLVAMNRVDGDLQNSTGGPLTTGLEAWLQAKGIEVEPTFVLDAQCASVTMQQQTSFGMMQQQVSFPFLPIISTFSQHPIGSGLESVLLQFASTIKFVGDTSKRFFPIAVTSEKSAVQSSPVSFDFQKEWTENDFPNQNLIVAAAIEGRFAGNTQSKMVVIADGDFPINGPPQQARRQQPDNINLLVNSIDWLSDDTGLIDLRTKGASVRPIRQLEDATKVWLKYLNFLLPVLLSVGYGLYRMQRNKIKQYKRMSENYSE
jgi:gliding-associated putative ABC transporter substrate-binding component GldG